VNTQQKNSMALHTSDGCSIKKTSDFTGSINSYNCYVKDPNQPSNQGCSVSADRTNTYGNGFNKAGGGVYATEWTGSAIKIWHFPKGGVPTDIEVSNFLWVNVG
jgi:hypothetical protein